MTNRFEIFIPNSKPMKTVLFLSGSGTNLKAIYNEQVKIQNSGEKNYGNIGLVFSNVPACRGIDLSRLLGISTVSLSSKRFFKILGENPDDEMLRDYYDSAVFSLIEDLVEPDLIILAGYRRRIGQVISNKYKNRIINLYPGDITKSNLKRGVDASIQAIRNGEKSIKASVFLHRTNNRFGPCILQSKPVSIEGFNENDKDKLNEKIRIEAEWKIFPYVVHELIAKGRVSVDEEDNIYIDNYKIPVNGYQFTDC